MAERAIRTLKESLVRRLTAEVGEETSGISYFQTFLLSTTACMFVVGCSCLEEFCTSGEAVTHVFEASFVFSRHLNMPRLDAWLKEATV